MVENLESRVGKNEFTLMDLGMFSVIVAILASVTMAKSNPLKLFSERKKEYVVSYESPYVRQLCDSALKNVANIQRTARLYEMDADKNEVITESEVIKYVRENSYKLK